MRTHSLRRELEIARYYVASKGGKRRDRRREAREGEPGESLARDGSCAW